MNKESMIRTGIGILGIFILPIMMSLVIGIGLFIVATTETGERQGQFREYGFYWILAAVCSYITFAIF